MTRYLRVFMVLAVLMVGGLVAAACGEEDDGDDAPAATESTDGETPDGGETPDDGAGATEEDDGDTSSGSFDDVPVPDGATESETGTFSADQIPFVDPGQSIDAGAYSNIEWRTYDVDLNAEAVLDFYETELSGWDEVFKLDSGPGAFGIWTRDGEVLWVGTTDIGEGTELMLIDGTSD